MSDALEPSASSIDAVARDDLTPRPTPGALPTSGPQPSRGGDGADGSVMSLVDHLAELRRRVAISIASVAVGGVLGFYFAPQIIKLLLEPLPNKRVVFLTLSGGFLLYFKIAVIVGILIGLPVIIYELWAFVAPGLTERERKTALPWLPFAVVFFLVGTIVAYVTLPYAVAFLAGFQIPGSVDFFPSAEAYFGFVTTIFIVFGAVMEFPIVLILLSKLGIVDRDRLRGSRRYVFLGIVVFSVVITPGGDPISPLVMSAVMYVLYEFTIFMLGRNPRDEPSDA
jgi:sec-independent protein translocase protein TatC